MLEMSDIIYASPASHDELVLDLQSDDVLQMVTI